jgi:acyl-coenzyme A synthetase/AMP-(fatty) acid ligase
MPELADCLVYGEKNPIMGQIVVADVVVREGVQPGEIRRRLRLFCKDRLAGYKIPAKVSVVDRTNFNERFKKIRRK